MWPFYSLEFTTFSQLTFKSHKSHMSCFTKYFSFYSLILYVFLGKTPANHCNGFSVFTFVCFILPSPNVAIKINLTFALCVIHLKTLNVNPGLPAQTEKTHKFPSHEIKKGLNSRFSKNKILFFDCFFLKCRPRGKCDTW